MTAIVIALLAATAAQAPQLDPLSAACEAFIVARDKQVGAQPRSEPRRLSIEKGAELFRRAEAYGYSGGLLVSQRGKTLISQGYGLADRAHGIPITPQTIFDVGSVAKQFTAAGILRLEELGKLRVEDPISKHLPNVPADKQAITIHHLLTHSAGFEHDVGEYDSRPSRDEAVRQILGSKLKWAAGTKYAYSNVDYALLAAIIEIASGTSYEAFLRQQLWQPAGMMKTGMVMGGLDRAPVAEGYFFDGPIPASIFLLERRAEGPSWLVRGAGYILSTLEDMARWGGALRTGTILSDSSRRKLFWPHVREDDTKPSYYGYGWALFSNPDGTCRIGHNGSANVHYDYLMFFPDRDALIVAYTTQQRTPWRHFPDRLIPTLFGTDPQLPPVAPGNRAELERLAGDYRLAHGSILPVRLQKGRLYVEMINADAMRLFSPWPMLPPERLVTLGDRQALISEVMNGISDRNYRPILTRLRKDADPEEERRFWDEHWPKWTREYGRYLGASLVGTVEMNDTVRSLALVRFQRNTILMGFIHGPDGRIYVDWMPQYAMRDIFLAPQSDGSFLAYHPATRRRIDVRFSGREISVSNGQETARAARLPGGADHRR